MTGYLLSRITHSVVHWGFPFSLSIEPTNCCNLHCPECPSGKDTLTREKGTMDPDLFRNIIDQLHPHVIYLNLHFQGEPYLHPHFTEFVSYAKTKGIYVSTSTNGHYLTPEKAADTVNSGLDRLIISVDGTDQETYQKYRVGGNYEKVIAGIRELVQQKKLSGSRKPKLVVQFLVLKPNEDQIMKIRQLGKELGVDKVELKTAQFYDFQHGNPLMPENPKHSRYRKVRSANKEALFEIRNLLPNHCFRMWSSCVITWDGQVVPCCFDKDATYKMGNIRDANFGVIWRNKIYQDFRQKILSSRKKIDICSNCTEGIGISRFF
ncbi:MAG: radical SAM/SPASM domain-containing protein [Bacteroidetes bacterium]|nr:radical SAM/SPASM domain-containing protein [Bacteroidota bacterium]